MLKEWVAADLRKSTRGCYLLDLSVTDIDAAKTLVSEKSADHAIVTTTLNLALPQTTTRSWQVWCYLRADWEGFKRELKVTALRCSDKCDASRAAARKTKLIVEKAPEYIPQRKLRTKRSTHPWLTKDLVHLRAVDRTHAYGDKVKVRSAGIVAEY